MPNLSRRSILAGLLAAPVAAAGILHATKRSLLAGAAQPDGLAAYAVPQTFDFIPFDANMGDVMINGLPLTKAGGAVIRAGELRAGRRYTVNIDLAAGRASISGLA